MGIVYVERNGRRYAYKASSRRVPGKPNPVSKMTYLGAVDPATGEIARRRTAGPEHIIADDGGFEMRGLGDALIAWSVARDIGMPRLLEPVFGDRWGTVLALAMAQACRPSSMDDAPSTISSTCIPELVGIGRKGLSGSVKETLRSMTAERIGSTLESIVTRSEGRVIVCSIYFDLFGRDPSAERRIRKGSPPSIGDLGVNILVGEDGMPLSYYFSSDSGRGPGSHLGILSEIRETRGITVVSDSSMESPAYIVELMTSGFDFAVSCDRKNQSFMGLVEEFLDEAGDPDGVIEFLGETCPVRQTVLGVTLSETGWDYLPSTDPRFDDHCMRFTALAYRRPRARRADLRNLESCIATTKAMLTDALEGRSPMNVNDMGAFMEFMDVSRNPDGSATVRVKRDLVSRTRSIAGMYVILTSLDREDALRSFETRASAIEDLSSFLDVIDGRWDRTVSLRSGNSNLLIHFLAGMIRAGIRRRLEGTGMSAEDALRTAATFSAISIGGRTLVSKRSMKVARLLGMFGVDDFDVDRLSGAGDGSRWEGAGRHGPDGASALHLGTGSLLQIGLDSRAVLLP